MSFTHDKLADNIYWIREEDGRECYSLMYLILGAGDTALLIDTGCGCGNIYHYLRSLSFMQNVKLIVVNTHNHPEQTGGNWRFSTTGSNGLAHLVEDLCAGRKNKYYTRLMDSSWHWEIQTYKVTRWLNDGDKILLGDESNLRNIVQVMWTPGHTPDSIVLWYPYANRLFVGDLFYRFDDIMFTYQYTDIRQYENSVRNVLKFVKSQEVTVKYSSAKNDTDNQCLPTFKLYHRFLLAVIAGTHAGTHLRIDEAEGVRYETRDKSMKIVIGRKIVQKLNEAREKANQGQ
ncbi:hypothetical protein L3Y34_011077 [Caenorhabditis briggsae]|uniref:Metallo-beta-lactamase domain-containing protein n=1 Tax=Caenorhabditis briggsae TaxID=6238 RepID=A0AAE9CTJ1_CAEBR|nr:hypothetical protein L3Y34_011077 [Caenorhabditis briggsae]